LAHIPRRFFEHGALVFEVAKPRVARVTEQPTERARGVVVVYVETAFSASFGGFAKSAASLRQTVEILQRQPKLLELTAAAVAVRRGGRLVVSSPCLGVYARLAVRPNGSWRSRAV
jgi:mannose/cellobiose epimerase-like protein (N-acyl-D-glucosamine 2-epimerase family)